MAGRQGGDSRRDFLENSSEIRIVLVQLCELRAAEDASPPVRTAPERDQKRPDEKERKMRSRFASRPCCMHVNII